MEQGDGRGPDGNAGGVVVIGDSLHPLSIFTSQGVNSALRDVLQLVRSLTDNVKADAGAELAANIDAGIQAFYAARAEEIREFAVEGVRLVAEFAFSEESLYTFVEDREALSTLQSQPALQG